MDQQTYDRMPPSIQIREIHAHVGHPGFRTESFVVVTTLTDTQKYTKDDVAQLYGHRWLAELDIRAIKITMGMDILRCKTPPMVHKEMWTCLLAYNLIRRAMLQSAQEAGQSPRRLSFSAALQAIALTYAIDINEVGQIVGCGDHNGEKRGFLLTPIPEPGTVLLLAIGGLAVIRHRR